MPAKQELQYNPVAEMLLVPFDDSEISEREGAADKNGFKQTFSYVPPERYRRRLLSTFAEGFDFYLTDVVEGKNGVRAIAHFKGAVSDSGVSYTIGVPVFEPWSAYTTGEREGKLFGIDQTYSKLTSAGIKAIARELGLGLHLYDKAQRKVSGSSSSTSSSSGSTAAVANDGEWTGEAEITFGTKWKNKRWKEVDDSYLQYLTRDPEKANALALKEIARRQKAAGAESGASAAQAAANADDEDDIPF